MLTLSAPADLTKQEREVLSILREELTKARERHAVGTLAIEMVLNDGHVTKKKVCTSYWEK